MIIWPMTVNSTSLRSVTRREQGLGGLAVGIATDKGTVTTTIEDQTGTDDPPGEEDTVYAVISVDDAAIEEGGQAIFTVSLQDKDGNAVTATSDIDVTLNVDRCCGECGRCGTVADDRYGDQWQYDGDGDCG
jgi:hypothetical protein